MKFIDLWRVCILVNIASGLKPYNCCFTQDNYNYLKYIDSIAHNSRSELFLLGFCHTLYFFYRVLPPYVLKLCFKQNNKLCRYSLSEPSSA